MFQTFRYLINIIALGSYYEKCISQFLRIVKTFCFCQLTELSHNTNSMKCSKKNLREYYFILFISFFSYHHLTLRKHGGHSSLLCFNDIHSRQVGSNRPVDLPGNVIVRARSTLPLLNSSL